MKFPKIIPADGFLFLLKVGLKTSPEASWAKTAASTPNKLDNFSNSENKKFSNSIINDILDFSKAEAGKIELEHISFNLKNLVKNIAIITRTNIKDKALIVSTDIDNDIPDYVLGDSVRLRQVLTNLTNNALKFTQSGEIKITAKLFKKTYEKKREIF